MTTGISNKHAGEWTDFHRMIPNTRGFHPRVFLISLEEFERRLWTREVRLRHSIPWIQPFGFICIFKPRVCHIFGNILLLVKRMHFAQVFAEDISLRQPLCAVRFGEITIGQEVPRASADGSPVKIEWSNS